MTTGVDLGFPSSRTGWRRREKEDETENEGPDGLSKMRGYVRSTMDYLLGDFRNYKSLTKSYIDVRAFADQVPPAGRFRGLNRLLPNAVVRDIYYPVPVPSQAGSLLASNLDVLYSRSIESLPGEDIYIPSYHIDTQPAATKDTPITDMSTTASGPSTSLYSLRSAESVSNPSSSQSVKGSSTVTTSFPGSSHEDSSGELKVLPIPRGGLVLTSGLASAVCASALYSISAWARQRSVTDAATEGLTVGMMAGGSKAVVSSVFGPVMAEVASVGIHTAATCNRLTKLDDAEGVSPASIELQRKRAVASAIGGAIGSKMLIGCAKGYTESREGNERKVLLAAAGLTGSVLGSLTAKWIVDLQFEASQNRRAAELST